MHVLSKKAFINASKKYPNDKTSIMDTYRGLKKSNFKTSNDLKKIFSSLDNFKYKKNWWIIDIGGNNLRLMAIILFKFKKIYVKHIINHAEYDKLCKKYKKEKS